MSQSTTQEKNSNVQVLRTGHFYDIFIKENKKYPSLLYSTGKKVKDKRRRSITISEFRKIITAYLKIYFYELYINRKSMYFFLGGFIKTVLCSNWTNIQKRGDSKEKTIHNIDSYIGIFWYYRPTVKSYILTKLLKQKGKHNQLPKIEREFLKRYDKDLLPIFTQEIKKCRDNKTLYRCIRT